MKGELDFMKREILFLNIDLDRLDHTQFAGFTGKHSYY
jgi:hypothetical protein